MLIRYLDVTRSQLLFAKGACFVEGISEALMLNTLSKIMGKCLVDNEIEIVNMDNTAFGQFLMLFNSGDVNRRLSQKAAFITDEDQYPQSKDAKYNTPQKLLENNCQLLNELRTNIYQGTVNNRVHNMQSLAHGQRAICIAHGLKTLEYQICIANVPILKADIFGRSLYKFVKQENADDMAVVDGYIASIASPNLTITQQQNIAILMWKCLPAKSEFAQNLTLYLDSELAKGTLIFDIPQYIQTAINHLV